MLCLGSSLTNGFPTLEELIRTGSLLERYSTHDGEMRSVPGVRSNCSGPPGPRISKITFIALPRLQPSGTDSLTLRFMRAGQGGPQDIVIDQETASFGEFGYEIMTINPPVMFNNGDMLLIRHGGSGLRLLHQVGDEARNICWSVESDSEIREPDYDYPLLAIETSIYYRESLD